MSRSVSEIMDHNFIYAFEKDSISSLLQEMIELGLGSIPVLDASGHPLGMATVSDIQRCRDLEELTQHVQRPVVSIAQNASIDDAARALAANHAERLVLLDGAGAAAGVVSALDVLRALLGFGITHSGHRGAAPAAEHWSASKVLELDALADVPKVPGVLVLAHIDDAEKPKIVWAESALNLHDRLAQMLRMRQEEPVLRSMLHESPRALAFRVMVVADEVRRGRMLRALHAVMRHSSAVQGTPATAVGER